MTKHRSSDRDTSVVIFLHWTRTVGRGKPYRASLIALAVAAFMIIETKVLGILRVGPDLLASVC